MSSTMFRTVVAAISIGAITTSCSDLQSIEGLTNILSAGLATSGDSNVAAGLKEALRIGAERTVASTSKPGGFLNNPLLRIELPSGLQTMAKGLRLAGMGSQVDALDVAMNQAAEKASAEAKPIFWNAISTMTLSDATGILRGGNTAATDYFRQRTSTSLQQRFRPVIQSNMEEVGLYQQYKQLVSAYTSLPLTKAPSLDLTEHVTDSALKGLFTVLGQEETRIRQDPAARTTELLKDVFANQ